MARSEITVRLVDSERVRDVLIVAYDLLQECEEAETLPALVRWKAERMRDAIDALVAANSHTRTDK